MFTCLLACLSIYMIDFFVYPFIRPSVPYANIKIEQYSLIQQSESIEILQQTTQMD